MYCDTLPPAVVNPPPAYKSLPTTASADTLLFTPEPRGDQLRPSHLAMLVPWLTYAPPTYRSLPDTASAYTPPPEHAKSPGPPEPSDHQLLPSHLATLPASMPPALKK